MPDTNKTEIFLQKLAPCIEHGELDGCVEGAARVGIVGFMQLPYVQLSAP